MARVTAASRSLSSVMLSFGLFLLLSLCPLGASQSEAPTNNDPTVDLPTQPNPLEGTTMAPATLPQPIVEPPLTETTVPQTQPPIDPISSPPPDPLPPTPLPTPLPPIIPLPPLSPLPSPPPTVETPILPPPRSTASNGVRLPLFVENDKRACDGCRMPQQVVTPPVLPCDCVFPITVNLSLSTNVNVFDSRQAQAFMRNFASTLPISKDQVALLGLRQVNGRVFMTIGLLPLQPKLLSLPADDVSKTTDRLYSIDFHNEEDMVDVLVLAVTPPANLLEFIEDNNGGSTAASPPPPAKTNHVKKDSIINFRDFVMLASAVMFVIIVAVSLITCAAVHHRRRKRLRRELSRIPMSIRRKSTDETSIISGWMWGLFPPMTAARKPSISFSLSAPGSPVRLTRFTMRELRDMTGNFGPQNLLGEGGFGRVYKAVRDGVPIAAIKKLEPQKDSGEREFWREVEVMSTLQHHNLVRLLGYCSDSEQFLLAYELCPRGSLQDNLFDAALKPALNWDLRLKIILQAGRGLQYLHDHRPPIVHRDFKSSNVLLDTNFTAKVSDFGLARLMPQGDQRHVSSRVLGTFGYVAPEYVMTGQLTTKSDVYSYGVVVLELITGRAPVDMDRPAGEQSLITWATPSLGDKDNLLTILDPDLQGMVNQRQLAQLAALAGLCIQPDANFRPLMSDVVHALELVINPDGMSTSGGESPEISVATPPGGPSSSVFQIVSPTLRSHLERLKNDGYESS